MSDFKLYGSLTSPYVRRVRIVALELGLSYTWTDAATAEGQASLREFNPLWKVPAARIDGEDIFESSTICQALIQKCERSCIVPLSVLAPAGQSAVATTMHVIDGVLDALINAFYLSKDGAGDNAYVQKQQARAEAALSWLETRIVGPSLTATATATAAGGFGLPEIALVTALEWMRFRNTYEVDRHPKLAGCASQYLSRPSVIETAPPQP